MFSTCAANGHHRQRSSLCPVAARQQAGRALLDVVGAKAIAGMVKAARCRAVRFVPAATRERATQLDSHGRCEVGLMGSCQVCFRRGLPALNMMRAALLFLADALLARRPLFLIEVHRLVRRFSGRGCLRRKNLESCGRLASDVVRAQLLCAGVVPQVCRLAVCDLPYWKSPPYGIRAFSAPQRVVLTARLLPPARLRRGARLTLFVGCRQKALAPPERGISRTVNGVISADRRYNVKVYAAANCPRPAAPRFIQRAPSRRIADLEIIADVQNLPEPALRRRYCMSANSAFGTLAEMSLG